MRVCQREEVQIPQPSAVAQWLLSLSWATIMLGVVDIELRQSVESHSIRISRKCALLRLAASQLWWHMQWHRRHLGCPIHAFSVVLPPMVGSVRTHASVIILWNNRPFLPSIRCPPELRTLMRLESQRAPIHLENLDKEKRVVAQPFFLVLHIPLILPLP